MLSIMFFTSPTLLFVSLIAFVSAIPAPDKYKHFKDPGCPRVGASACLLLDYCNRHLKKGDLYTSRNGILKSRDAPEPDILNFNLTDASISPSLPLPFTTRELDVNWKRTPLSAHCGILSCVVNKEVSDRFTLVGGVFYDLIVDYPYNGATGGLIGIFARFTVNGVAQTERMGQANTGFGGLRFRFLTNRNANWYQVIFTGENAATAAINYYLVRVWGD